jgi:hypothetical protein
MYIRQSPLCAATAHIRDRCVSEKIKKMKSISKIDDLVDEFLEPISDYVDTVEDISSYFKFFKSIHDKRKRIQFEQFLKGYLNEKDTKEIDKEELKKALKKKKNIIYVSEIIENALSSKSVIASSILGIIAGQILKSDKNDYSNNDYILISALAEISDKDIELFLQITELIRKDGIPKREVNSNEYEYRLSDIYKEVNNQEIKMTLKDAEYAVEKLKRIGVLSYSGGGTGLYGNNKGAFMLTDESNQLEEYIKKVK